MVWIDYDDGHAGGYPHECNHCTGSQGRMTCDLPAAHDGLHYNDLAGTLFRTDGRTPLGKKIRAHRDAANVSLSELSRRSGVAKSYISTLENDSADSRRPSFRTIEALAAALKLSVKALQSTATDASRTAHGDHTAAEVK